MPWWGITLLCVGSAGVGAAIGGAAMLLYVGRGLWG
jgi:hypothetical protein